MMNKKRWFLIGGAAALLIGTIAAAAIGNSSEKEKLKPPAEEVTELADPLSVEYEEGTRSVEEILVPAADYEEIYGRLAEYYETAYSGKDDISAGDGAVPEEMTDVTEAAELAFTRVSEYAEAPGTVCKQDGDYIYLQEGSNFLTMVRAEGPEMTPAGAVFDFQSESEFIVDYFVSETALSVITSCMDEVTFSQTTAIYTYDMAVPEIPVLLSRHELEGSFEGASQEESKLYVYTGCYKQGMITAEGTVAPMETLEEGAYVPLADGAPLQPQQVYLPEKAADTGFFMCAALDMFSPESLLDVKAFLAVSEVYYQGSEGLFVTLKNGLYNVTKTVIVQLLLGDGKILPSSAAVVQGYLMDEGAFSEEDGQLRVISTVAEQGVFTSRYYLFDNKMQQIGKQEDISGGEKLQSVRFVEDTLYGAVAGELPLLVMDVKETAKEPVRCERIEHFESFLYPYKEDRILTVSYGEEQRIYMAMFDVSGELPVQLHAAEISGDATPAVGEPDSVFVDEQQNLIGFATEDWDEGYMNADHKYRLFHYSDENGFAAVLEVPLSEGNCWNVRSFMKESYFYAAEKDAGVLRCFDAANGFVQIGELYY